MICFHSPDLDGCCAAAILFHFSRHCRFVEVRCKSLPLTSLNDIFKEETVYVLDIPLSQGDLESILKVSSSIVWIDHHESDLLRREDINGIRDTGLSTCELTWMYLHTKKPIPKAIKLIEGYERLEALPTSVMSFIFGLKCRCTSPQSDIWYRLIGERDSSHAERAVDELSSEGASYVNFISSYGEKLLLKYGFKTNFKGLRCIALNLCGFDDVPFYYAGSYDAYIAFAFDGDKWIVTIYSSCYNMLDVTKEYGGIGTERAARFVCDTLPFKKDE